MHQSKYDFIIIGMGASGCLFLLELLKAFPHKRVLLVDSSLKLESDKTWCFWEKGSGDLDEIVFHKWSFGKFDSQLSKNSQLFSLRPYQYKMIQSLDLYNLIREKIEQNKSVDFCQAEVQHITEDRASVEVHTKEQSFFCDRVFDSRFNYIDFSNKQEECREVLQHFKGWFVKFEEDVLDDSSFTMMDYRYGEKRATNFMYVLPFCKNKALFESTYFSPSLVQEKTYDEEIKAYLAKKYPNKAYSIQDTETGIIPMSMYPFSSKSSGRVIKIGTAGGAVKPSSGYSFQFSRKIAKQFIQDLKANKQDVRYKQRLKYRFYDRVFLGVLQNHNELGEEIFHQMYLKNSIHSIFRFLDEESSWLDDFKIIFSFCTPKLILKFIKEVF